MKNTILFSLLAINITIGQNIQNDKHDYSVEKRKNTGIVNLNNNTKKYSKTQIKDLEFCKELASTLSKDLLQKTDKIIISEETASFKKKDSVGYVVYDFILKKKTKIEDIKNNLNFGIKDIGLYKIPVICNTFSNIDRITCICRGLYKSDFIMEEEFVNTIKATTEDRIKAVLKN